MPSRSLPALLRRARWDSGLSQRDLAVLLGRSQSWISKVESGQLDIVPEETACWVDRCGYVIDGSGLAPRVRPLDLFQVAAFQQLAPHVRLRRALLTYAHRGRPLGDVAPDVALARIRREAVARPGAAVAGALAASFWTPDAHDHPDFPRISLGRSAETGRVVRLGRLHRSATVRLPDLAELRATGWDSSSAETAAAAADWWKRAGRLRSVGANPFAVAP